LRVSPGCSDSKRGSSKLFRQESDKNANAGKSMERVGVPIGLPALAFLSDWQIASCTAAPQTVQSTERPIDVMRGIAPGIVGNLSGRHG